MVNIYIYTSREGLRERAEASLGRERMRLQTLFHCFETHVADANHTAGSLSRMFCNTSPFISSNHGVVRCVLVLLILNVDDDDDDEENEEVSASAIVVEIEKNKNQKKLKDNTLWLTLHGCIYYVITQSSHVDFLLLLLFFYFFIYKYNCLNFATCVIYYFYYFLYI